MRSNISIHNVIGESPWTVKVRQRILQVAGYHYGVLITGPSGTGKELIARSIHTHGPRAAKPFIPVNCAALPGELFCSQVFGHIKGAFTGAGQSTLGCFRAADGGTIFLDEIGELDFDLQAKLLRVVQDRRVTPVGSHESLPVDVRVVAATNRNLEQDVRDGRFRLDLYYRLNVISVHAAPLVDRRQDIPVLARHFLAKACVENGTAVKQLHPDTLALMQAYRWPGNIRQLQNLIERAVVFAEGDLLGPDCFPELLDGSDFPPSDARFHPGGAPAPLVKPASGRRSNQSDNGPPEPWIEPVGPTEDAWLTLADVERSHIARTLQETFYNQSAAARLLGIDRKLLARKIRKYRLQLPPTSPGRPARR